MSEIYCGTTQVFTKNFNKLSEHASSLKVFKIKLSSYYDLVPKLIIYLDTAELQRAQKYHFKKDKNRYVICRALLKFILARYSGISVVKINIQEDANKKPYLVSNKTICFNISHAENLAVIAVSNTTVGIDLEHLNTNFDFSEILPYSFSNLEINTIAKAKNKTYLFYKFWTRKEAIVKATGKGISDHLPQIPAMDGRHSVSSKLIENFKNLQILSFDLDGHYIASIALIDMHLRIDKLAVYNLPNSIEGLISFSN